MIGFGQQTYVPDDNFEQALINSGYDNVLDDSVATININTLTFLSIGSNNPQFAIYDLTGIEDFTALITLECSYNQITSLDVSQNSALTSLNCRSNQLTSLDVSNNTALIELHCAQNQLTSLEVSGATALTYLDCEYNQLTSLNLSQNIDLNGLDCDHNQLTSLDVSTSLVLEDLNCSDNQLTNLDLRNGNNLNWSEFDCTQNPNLNCISVDDSTWANNNWTFTMGLIDQQHYFSNNCSTTAIEEYSTNKELLKVIDLLGRETKGTKNEVLFYIYDDGTVEKRIVIE